MDLPTQSRLFFAAGNRRSNLRWVQGRNCCNIICFYGLSMELFGAALFLKFFGAAPWQKELLACDSRSSFFSWRCNHRSNKFFLNFAATAVAKNFLCAANAAEHFFCAAPQTLQHTDDKYARVGGLAWAFFYAVDELHQVRAPPRLRGGGTIDSFFCVCRSSASASTAQRINESLPGNASAISSSNGSIKASRSVTPEGHRPRGRSPKISHLARSSSASREAAHPQARYSTVALVSNQRLFF